MTSAAVGLVLAGGGARGAYEAGALSVLLPALERRGERPSILVGTSVAAINAAFLATAHDIDAIVCARSGTLPRHRRLIRGLHQTTDTR